MEHLNISDTIFDSHIHFGQYYNIYTSAEDIISFMDSVGIHKCAISSTTTCENNFRKVMSEMIHLVRSIQDNRIMPVLWVTPKMIEEQSSLDMMLQSGILWRCIKIHPQLNPSDWGTDSVYTNAVISLATSWNLPVLIHTGEMPGCYASLFEGIIHKNSHLQFILAHGRPLHETIDIMHRNSNCWTDTAFMPLRHIEKLCREHLSNRVLWGTDCPIQQHYYHYCNTDLIRYYLTILKNLRRRVSDENFIKITSQNFIRLFGG